MSVLEGETVKLGVTLSTKFLMKLTWDPTSRKDCETLEGVFQTLRRQGKPIFKASEDWKPGEQLEKFDKNLGRMVVFPRPTAWDKILGEST